MDWKYLRMLAALAALAAACGPMAGTTQPEWAPLSPAVPEAPNGETRVFDPCQATASIDPTKRALGAMFLSLTEREWTIDQFDIDNNIITGSVCLRNNPSHCASYRFLCGKNGDVFAEPTYVQHEVHDDLQRWLTALGQAFSKFRCYTDPAMREEVSKYGIVY